MEKNISRTPSPEPFLEEEKVEKVEKVEEEKEEKVEKVKKKFNKLNFKSNRGTGAGGANTNKNGLPFEKSTDLESTCSVEREEKYADYVKFVNDTSNKIYCHIKEKKLLKYLVPKVPGAHGCKQPDDCYIEEEEKIIFIIEKKMQKVSGSVGEKIQTGPFKRHHYKEMYPDYEIVYIYCLSKFFKKNYEAELKYLKKEKIPVFWGEEPDYFKKLSDFIINFNCKPLILDKSTQVSCNELHDEHQ